MILFEFAKTRYANLLSALFGFLIIVTNDQQPVWIIMVVVVTFLYPVAFALNKIVMSLQGVLSAKQKRPFSLAAFFISLLLLYVFVVPRAQIEFIFWFVLFFLFVVYCFVKNKRGLYASSLALVFLILFFVSLAHITRWEFHALHYARFKYQVFEQAKRQKIASWVWTHHEDGNIFTLSYNGVEKLLELRPVLGLSFHDNQSTSGSMDYPLPGLFLGSLSSRQSDPFASPSISIFAIQQSNVNDAITSFYEQCKSVFLRRVKEGVIQNLVFSGKVSFDAIPGVFLRGVSVRYYDVVTQKNRQVGLYYIEKSKKPYALMTIEESLVGFPMDSALVQQISQIFSK